MWAVTDACDPVTWQECKLVTKNVQFIVLDMSCYDKQELWYYEPEPQTDTRMTNTLKCEVKSTTNCQSHTRQDCKQITWNECRSDIKELHTLEIINILILEMFQPTTVATRNSTFQPKIFCTGKSVYSQILIMHQVRVK